jgi:hypothetical protein
MSRNTIIVEILTRLSHNSELIRYDVSFSKNILTNCSLVVLTLPIIRIRKSQNPLRRVNKIKFRLPTISCFAGYYGIDTYFFIFHRLCNFVRFVTTCNFTLQHRLALILFLANIFGNAEGGHFIINKDFHTEVTRPAFLLYRFNENKSLILSALLIL